MRAIQLQRRTLVLLGVLAVLVAGYLLGVVLSPERLQERAAAIRVLPALDPEAIREVRMVRQGRTISLLKPGETWQVQIEGRSLPADRDHITGLLEHLASLKRLRVVSADPATWERLGVGEEPRGRVRLLDAGGRPLADLLVGEREPEGKGSYVRLAGGSESFLTDGSPDFYLDAAAPYWSELRLFPESLSPDRVTRIEVAASIRLAPGDERQLDYALSRGQGPEGGWRVQPRGREEQTASAAEAERMAGGVVALRGTEFAVGVTEVQAGLAAPQARVRFRTSEGQWRTILVGAGAGGDAFYLGTESGDYLYRVAAWRLELLLQRPEELMAGGGS